MTAFKAVTYEGVDVQVPITNYPYTPFGADDRRFRLLTVFLGEGNESVIEAEMRQYSLDDCPGYTALSYQWGDPSQYRWILVDSVYFPVTENLMHALKALRAKECSLVWIDAICIDQNNDQEKATHIPIMTEIYQRAEAVCAWVGEESDGSDKVMDMFRALDISRKQSISATPWTPNGTVIQRYAPALLAFWDRPYWRRVWIIQELSVASRIYVLCGKKLVSWAGLDMMVAWLQQQSDKLAEERYKSETSFRGLFASATKDPTPDTNSLINTPSFRHLHGLLRSRKYNLEARPVGLLENVYNSITANTTVPRDKVFALLGVSFDKTAFVKTPTYGCSETEMCIEMTKSYFWTKKSLDIILLAGLATRPDTAGLRPSWCPDYFRLEPASHLNVLCAYLSGHSERYRCGHLTGRWQATGDSVVTRGAVKIENDYYLITTGKCVGRIQSLGPSQGGVLLPQSTDPSETQSSQLDKEAEILVINEALLMYAKAYAELVSEPSTLRYVFRFDSTFDYNTKQVRDLKHRLDRILLWRKVNGDLIIGRRSLQRTAESFTASTMVRDRYSTPWTEVVGGALGSGIVEGLFSGPSSSSSSSRSRSYNDTKVVRPELVNALENLQDLIDEGLRFMSTTENFHVGWAHPNARPGDEVYLLAGCSMPVILRPSVQFPGTYSVIGHSYLNGMMDGRYWHKLLRAELQEVILS